MSLTSAAPCSTYCPIMLSELMSRYYEHRGAPPPQLRQAHVLVGVGPMCVTSQRCPMLDLLPDYVVKTHQRYCPRGRQHTYQMLVDDASAGVE